MATCEREIADYNGFKVILPANMHAGKPYVILRANGSYNVDIATANGIFTKFNNCLEGLEDRAIRIKGLIKNLNEKRDLALIELNKTVDYSEQINLAKLELAKIDEELGVKLDG